MQTGLNFSAAEWIIEKITGAESLLPETLKALRILRSCRIYWEVYYVIGLRISIGLKDSVLKYRTMKPTWRQLQGFSPTRERYCSAS